MAEAPGAETLVRMLLEALATKVEHIMHLEEVITTQRVEIAMLRVEVSVLNGKAQSG